MKEGFVVVFVTAPDMDLAVEIGRKTVEEGLAACCNVVPGVRSIYAWKGEICDDPEVLCVLKTRESLFGALKDRVIELHTYEVPEVIAMKIEAGHGDYLDWIKGSTVPRK